MRESINLEKAVEIIKKNITSIIILTLVFGIIAALITFFLIPPRYQAQTQILVSESEETENTSDQDIETSLQLIGTYSDILQSPIVLENVINNLELDKSFSSLSEQITVVNQEQSQVLTVTVTDETDEKGEMLPDSERLTAVGIMIRKYSLDELPQLINVIKGDLSIVGPRPLLMQYMELYSDCQMKRHETRPGITGWAQVNGRNTLSWEEKFEMDVWYVENHTFWLDLKILAMTVQKVLKSEGINQEGESTARAFTGNKADS